MSSPSGRSINKFLVGSNGLIIPPSTTPRICPCGEGKMHYLQRPEDCLNGLGFSLYITCDECRDEYETSMQNTKKLADALERDKKKVYWKEHAAFQKDTEDMDVDMKGMRVIKKETGLGKINFPPPTMKLVLMEKKGNEKRPSYSACLNRVKYMMEYYPILLGR